MRPVRLVDLAQMTAAQLFTIAAELLADGASPLLVRAVARRGLATLDARKGRAG